MTREDIIRMARQAGFETKRDMIWVDQWEISPTLTRFATLVAAAEREKVANWMRSMGYATGQGKTTEDLLDFLGVGIVEGLEAEVLTERNRLPPAAECCRMCKHKGVCNEKAKGNEAD